MRERRSRSAASWFFRVTSKSWVRYFAVLLIVGGWTLMLVAAANAPLTQQSDDTAAHLSFLWMVVGGFLSFMGIFAGISKWVAEPAARKVMSEHTRLGALAHPELMARPEWDLKHNELMDEVNEIKVMVAELSGRSGGMARERNS